MSYESVYPVPQPRSESLRPSSVVFTLPTTTPTVLVSLTIIRGIEQDILVVPSSKLILAVIENVSRIVSRGLDQDLLIVNPSSIVKPPPLEIRSILPLRGLFQDLLEVNPSKTVRE